MILPHRLVGLGYDSSPTSCGLLVKINYCLLQLDLVNRTGVAA